MDIFECINFLISTFCVCACGHPPKGLPLPLFTPPLQYVTQLYTTFGEELQYLP
jgi:hypothetical protein